MSHLFYKFYTALLLSNVSYSPCYFRLPLPSTINQLFLGSPDVNSAPEDNPNLHEGRIRSFPHQRGNWSTYVYVPCEFSLNN